jgi:hypothetical protein
VVLTEGYEETAGKDAVHADIHGGHVSGGDTADKQQGRGHAETPAQHRQTMASDGNRAMCRIRRLAVRRGDDVFLLFTSPIASQVVTNPNPGAGPDRNLNSWGDEAEPLGAE